MTYLGREVFTFSVNWAAAPVRRFAYDLREVDIGFGAEVFTGRGQYVVNGWRADIHLPDRAAISEFEAFCDTVKGRLRGFWLPVPIEAFKIVANASPTEFDIGWQDLTSTWNQAPDIYLYFSSGHAAKITSVVNGGATERVTVDAAVSAGPDVMVFRMHYVRFADDVERETVVAENEGVRTLSFIELPSEYAAAESGERPIYLYHFWCAAPVDYHWRFTSFAATVFSNGDEFSPANLLHTAIRESSNLEVATTEIRATYHASHPLSLFLPSPIPRSVNVEIFKVDYADPEIRTRLFTGRVSSVNDNGEILTAECESFAHILRKRAPHMMMIRDCSYRLYDARTCKVTQARYETPATVTAINNSAQPPTVEVTLMFPRADRTAANYFEQGWMETGKQLQFEVRTIFASSWNPATSRLTLTISDQLRHAQVGDRVALIPGCDGEMATCRTKFKNEDNFPGFPFMPVDNLSLTAVENRKSQGDKK